MKPAIDVQTLVSAARAAGLKLTPGRGGEKLRVRGDSATIDRWTPDLTANKRDILAYLAHEVACQGACAGLPLDEDSGKPFCPWGPYVTADMLNAWRRDLRELVAELAAVEGWTDQRRANVAYHVEHQPGLATLRDDITYFTERLGYARRDVERTNAWRREGLVDPHCCVGGSGECVGAGKGYKRTRDGK